MTPKEIAELIYSEFSPLTKMTVEESIIHVEQLIRQSNDQVLTDWITGKTRYHSYKAREDSAEIVSIANKKEDPRNTVGDYSEALNHPFKMQIGGTPKQKES